MEIAHNGSRRTLTSLALGKLMDTRWAFEIYRNPTAPEKKRSFWPKFAEIVGNSDGTVVDVFQVYERPTEDEIHKALSTYPGCCSFSVTTGTIHHEFGSCANAVLKAGELSHKAHEST